VVVHVDTAVLAGPEQPGQSVLEEGSHLSAETSRRLTGAATGVAPSGPELSFRGLSRAIRTGPSRASLGAGRPYHAWQPRPAVPPPSSRSTRRRLPRRSRTRRRARLPRPDGRPLPQAPPTAPVSADPIHTLHAQHAALGLRLHARTACPGWLGERLDVGWALDVLHPRAVGPGPC
jgi:hypothetical protein